MQTLLDYLNNPVGTAKIDTEQGIVETIKVYKNNIHYFCSFISKHDNITAIHLRIFTLQEPSMYILNNYSFMLNTKYKITWNKEEPLMLLHIKESK